jgi:hypothetical protein
VVGINSATTKNLEFGNYAHASPVIVWIACHHSVDVPVTCAIIGDVSATCLLLKSTSVDLSAYRFGQRIFNVSLLNRTGWIWG